MGHHGVSIMGRLGVEPAGPGTGHQLCQIQSSKQQKQYVTYNILYVHNIEAEGHNLALAPRATRRDAQVEGAVTTR